MGHMDQIEQGQMWERIDAGEVAAIRPQNNTGFGQFTMRDGGKLFEPYFCPEGLPAEPNQEAIKHLQRGTHAPVRYKPFEIEGGRYEIPRPMYIHRERWIPHLKGERAERVNLTGLNNDNNFREARSRLRMLLRSGQLYTLQQDEDALDWSERLDRAMPFVVDPHYGDRNQFEMRVKIYDPRYVDRDGDTQACILPWQSELLTGQLFSPHDDQALRWFTALRELTQQEGH